MLTIFHGLDLKLKRNWTVVITCAVGGVNYKLDFLVFICRRL